MATLRYITGDATVPQGEGPKIITHICNDVGAWGAGFVLALSRRWPEPEAAYRNWSRTGSNFKLGEVQFVKVLPSGDGPYGYATSPLFVANMIAQVSPGFAVPIRYEALEACLAKVRDFAVDASVHMPRIGAGLAGGIWPVIEEIIEQQLVDHGVDVTVYDLPAR